MTGDSTSLIHCEVVLPPPHLASPVLGRPAPGKLLDEWNWASWGQGRAAQAIGEQGEIGEETSSQGRQTLRSPGPGLCHVWSSVQLGGGRASGLGSGLSVPLFVAPMGCLHDPDS